LRQIFIDKEYKTVRDYKVNLLIQNIINMKLEKISLSKFDAIAKHELASLFGGSDPTTDEPTETPTGDGETLDELTVTPDGIKTDPLTDEEKEEADKV
jgi:natural product precursor